MKYRQDATEIFLAGVESVRPDNLIRRFISADKGILKIDKINLDLAAIRNIHVVGMGKASALMAQTVESILGDRITSGHIVTKYGHSAALNFIGVTEAGHPVPDENGLKGTGQILSIVEKAGEDDLVMCLISGGGSALLADVPEGCSLDDLKLVNSVLLQTGADITEMNCIRKHLSKVKGGLLAKAAFPARIISLMLSDVIGDPMDVIASGPTVPDPTTFADALKMLQKYNIENRIPHQVLGILKEGAEGKRDETLKEDDQVFLRTDNLIIGNNSLALQSAGKKADSLGYVVRIITNSLAGDVHEAADYIFRNALQYRNQAENKKMCLLFAGEPTVKLKGNGLGGRNQHLALICSKLLKDVPGITILSGGTDGSDGPTDAAGAVVDCFTCGNALKQGLKIDEYLENNDSYNFFKQEGGLIKTGPTKTNVRDLMIALSDQ